jgi:uncharacterized membrane protein YqiK
MHEQAKAQAIINSLVRQRDQALHALTMAEVDRDLAVAELAALRKAAEGAGEGSTGEL